MPGLVVNFMGFYNPNLKVIFLARFLHFSARFRPTKGSPPQDAANPLLGRHQSSPEAAKFVKISKSSGGVNFNVRSTTIRPPPVETTTTTGFPTLWSTKPNRQFGLKRCQKQRILTKAHCPNEKGLDWNF